MAYKWIISGLLFLVIFDNEQEKERLVRKLK